VLDFTPHEDHRYLYAVGRIKALEVKLLTPDFSLKLLEAKNCPQVLQQLKEINYGLGETIDEELILNQELKKSFSFLEKILPEKEILNFFRLKYDFHNLKVFLKTFSKKPTPEKQDLFIDLNQITPNDFKEMIEQNKFFKFPSAIQEPIEQAVRNFKKNFNNKILADELDKILLSYLKRLAEQCKISLLQKISEIYLDFYQIMILVRAKIRGSEVEKKEEVFSGGGTLEKKFFVKASALSLDDFQKELEKTVYYSFIQGIEQLKKHSTYLYLEREQDKFILNFTERAKYCHLGPDPIIRYLLVKEREIKNLRMIFAGIKNNWRVRDFLVF
jgi:V/A-type H+-transporting ATPase subunit C